MFGFKSDTNLYFFEKSLETAIDKKKQVESRDKVKCSLIHHRATVEELTIHLRG